MPSPHLPSRLPASALDPAVPADRVLLYGRTGCHLCDVARQVVSEVCGELSVGWHEEDVDADGRLATAYGDLVPVVLVDGSVLATWRVDASALRAALAG